MVFMSAILFIIGALLSLRNNPIGFIILFMSIVSFMEA